jgi:protein TonB
MDLQQGQAMSTEILYAMKPQLSTVQSNTVRSDISSIRALDLAVRSSPAPAQRKLSAPILMLVIGLHAALFYLAITAPIEPPAIEKPEAPMLVSLVENPAPEMKAPEPAPPEPKPVVKKVIPKPKKPEPTPQPEVVQPTPAPAEVTPVPVKVAEQVTQPEPQKPEVVEKPIPPKEEPVIEPKFGAAYLKNPPPDYPTLSRRVGEQGRVLLRVLVSEQGAPQTVELESGSGYSRLDQAAVDAVKKWRFVPARRGNQAISAYVLVPLKFSLDS